MQPEDLGGEKTKNKEKNKTTMKCKLRPGTEKAKTNHSKGQANEQCNLKYGDPKA
jgi:hypothetical protein